MPCSQLHQCIKRVQLRFIYNMKDVIDFQHPLVIFRSTVHFFPAKVPHPSCHTSSQTFPMQHSAHPTVMKDTHHVPKAWIPVSKNETFRHRFQWFRVTCVVAEREFYGRGLFSKSRLEFRWRARSYVISARPACSARRSPNHLPTPPIPAASHPAAKERRQPGD